MKSIIEEAEEKVFGVLYDNKTDDADEGSWIDGRDFRKVAKMIVNRLFEHPSQPEQKEGEKTYQYYFNTAIIQGWHTIPESWINNPERIPILIGAKILKELSPAQPTAEKVFTKEEMIGFAEWLEKEWFLYEENGLWYSLITTDLKEEIEKTGGIESIGYTTGQMLNHYLTSLKEK